jgi:hypothetical protein
MPGSVSIAHHGGAVLSPVACNENSGAIPELDHHGHWFQARQIWAEQLRRALFLLLLVLVAAAPFAPHFVQLVSRLALGCWIARVVLIGHGVKIRPLFLPFLTFFGVAGLSALLSYDPLLSWTRVGWFGMGVLILIVPDLAQSRRNLKLLLLVLLVSSSISGIRTAWQYTVGIGTKLVNVRRDCPLAGDGLWSGDMIQEINGHRTRIPSQWRRALQITRRDQKLKLHVARSYPLQHFDVIIERAHLDGWLADPTASVERATPLRAQGGFYNSIPYAGLLMVLAALSCGLFLTAPSLPDRVVLGSLSVLLATSLWLTVTRAYIVALLISVLLMLSQSAGQKLRRISFLAIVLAVAGTLAWTRQARDLPDWYGEQNQARIMMWEDSPRLILRHPVLGIGWDSVFSHGLQWNLQAYKAYPDKLSHFHSTPIQVAVDSGLIGLAAWAWLLVCWGRLLARNLRLSREQDWFSRGLALGLLGSAAGFVIASLVHYTLGDGEVMGTMWFLMGCAVALHAQLQGCAASD